MLGATFLSPNLLIHRTPRTKYERYPSIFILLCRLTLFREAYGRRLPPGLPTGAGQHPAGQSSGMGPSSPIDLRLVPSLRSSIRSRLIVIKRG